MAYGSISVDQINNTTGYSLGAGDASMLKNRLINGAMVIDQRNSGASMTPINGQYSVDRWNCYLGAASKYTTQQVADGPAGFINSLKITSSSSYSAGASEYFMITQRIEGYNTADFGWGGANAKTVTLSFWVKSSLTGTFGFMLQDTNADNDYATTYTIIQANTWEYKTITIPGCTFGTWNTNSSASLTLRFNLGSGTNYQTGTLNSWFAAGGSSYYAPTGTVSVVGTSGATWQITGAQLEVGSSATGFEYRHYGHELNLCLRYFWRKKGYNSGGNTMIGAGMQYNGGDVRCVLQHPVPMRTAPSITFNGSAIGFERPTLSYGSIGTLYSANYTPECSLLYTQGATSTGMSNGYGTMWGFTDTSSSIDVSAEL